MQSRPRARQAPWRRLLRTAVAKAQASVDLAATIDALVLDGWPGFSDRVGMVRELSVYRRRKREYLGTLPYPLSDTPRVEYIGACDALILIVMRMENDRAIVFPADIDHALDQWRKAVKDFDAVNVKKAPLMRP